MPDDDRPNEPRPAGLIYDTREYVQEVRNHYWDTGVDGETSPEMKKHLAKAAIKYWDVLYEFRDETVLDDGDFPDIGPVRQRLGRQTEVIAESAGRGRGMTTRQVPAVDELSAEYLLELTEQLDDLAKTLGFAASAREQTPRDRASMADLKGLLSARGQDEAIEKLPDEDGGEA